MTFVKHNDIWREVDLRTADDLLKAYNLAGGYTYIPRKDIKDYVEAENWHDLYLKTGYRPLLSDYTEHCAWIDTEGNFYEARAHLIAAEYICEVIFGKEDDGYFDADDFLRENGWVKVTTSLMFQYYKEEGQYKHMTEKQRNAFYEWCKYHKMSY